MRNKLIILAAVVLGPKLYAQDCLKDLGGGMCIVTENNKYGIKKKGKFIVPAYFDQLVDHSGKYFSVEQNEKWGIFDVKGRLLLEPAYDKITVHDASNHLIHAKGKGSNSLVVTDKLVRPSNAVRFSPFLCASRYETTVAEYMAFMEDIKNSPVDGFSYSEATPDVNKMAENTRAILNAFVSNEECRQRYTVPGVEQEIHAEIPCSIMNDKKLKGFLTMPITGITYAQAQKYLEWLTRKMNKELTGDVPYKFIIRLPKPEEWVQLAESGLSEAMKKNKSLDSLNVKKCLLFNHKFNKEACTHTEDQIKRYGNNLVPYSSYNPDLIGLFNVYGNAAEMTAEEGISKGGSYAHPARHANTAVALPYKQAEPWLGLRWVLEFQMK